MTKKTLGTGVGKGHGSNTFNFPIIREVTQNAMDQMNQFTVIQFGDASVRWFKMGKIRACLTLDDNLGYTLSVSHNRRYPTWDEVCHLRYELIPDNHTMMMMLPPKDEYINMHNFCFILTELKTIEVNPDDRP